MEHRIGILLLDHIPLGVDRVDAPGRHCTHAATAQAGACVWASDQDISCPLARFVLGLDPASPEVIDALAAEIVDWGFAADEHLARQFVGGLWTIPHGEKILVYGPPDRLPDEPDVTIEILTPHEAMRALVSNTHRAGLRALGDMSGVGALCAECTAYPLHSERVAISVGCPGSRRELALDPDKLLMATPRVHSERLTLDVV
ncbi:MAG: DUF169 domain-containing protein [Candidatus Bipolaricaulota bacterium]|nr:MAG: DUF169 domain-containing protein [Candidatus Bipolaricaulota bacterium]